jgi:hypothetical protein
MYVCVNAKHDIDTNRGDDARHTKPSRFKGRWRAVLEVMRQTRITDIRDSKVDIRMSFTAVRSPMIQFCIFHDMACGMIS